MMKRATKRPSKQPTQEVQLPLYLEAPPLRPAPKKESTPKSKEPDVDFALDFYI